MAKGTTRTPRGTNKTPGTATGTVVTQQIIVRPPVRSSGIGIQDIRMAQKMAEFIANPSRVKLIDLMEDALMDLHLTGIIGKRMRSVRNKKLRYVDAQGKEVEGMETLIKSKEFRKLRKLIFNTIMWGITGVEFLPGAKFAFKPIRRKHIKPESGKITFEQNGNEGIDYTNAWNLWIMQTDEEDNNFGLLLKLLPYVIYKRGCFGDWGTYVEQYGQPVRVAKYDAYDINTRRQVEEMLEKAGASLSVMMPKQADFEIKDGKQSNGDGKLQENFKNACDEQMSIGVLGQTETTKSSASSGYAQGKIHEDQQLEITQDDMDYELDWLNDPFFINILQSYGYPVSEGGEFQHEEEANTGWMLQNIALDEKLGQIIPLDDDYYYETYKRPKPKDYERLKAEKEARRVDTPPEPKKAAKGKKKGQDDDIDEEEELDNLSDESKGLLGDLKDLLDAGNKFLKKRFGFFRQAPAKPGRLTIDLADLYASHCPVCGGLALPNLAGGDDAFFSIMQDIAGNLYNKKLKDGHIPDALYRQTAEQLMQGVFEGLGGSSFGYDDKRNDLRAYLEHNIYAFSAAKSLTELKEFRGLMVAPDGRLRTEAEFRNACVDAGKQFNKNYLETERVTAIASAQTAVQFQSFGENEAIEISTVGDNRVRPEHALLDGFTALASDPVWRRLCPPFDWLCRCTLVPGALSKIKEVDKAQLIKDANIPKYFQNNPALTKAVFSEEHPYYVNSYGKETQMSAEEVYNMPSVKKLYESNEFPLPVELDSKEAANAWWKDKAGTLKGAFDETDYNGLTIRFDNTFRKHVFEANKESRYTHLGNLEDILKNPDEVWSNMEGGKLKRFYLKYYNDYPHVIRVDGTDAYTMHNFEKDGKLNDQSLKKLRRGVLLHRKN